MMFSVCYSGSQPHRHLGWINPFTFPCLFLLPGGWRQSCLISSKTVPRSSVFPWPYHLVTILVTILYELMSDPDPTTPKSQRFQWSQLVETCSFSSKTTNKRSLIPFFVDLCHSLCAFPWCQLWECLTKKAGCNSSPDVPLSLASECRLVIRRSLKDTQSSTVASLGMD